MLHLRRLGRSARVRANLKVEQLEGRLVPAVLTVNNPLDTNARSDALTLRAAIALTDGTLHVSDLTAQEKAQVTGIPDTAGQSDTIDFALPSAPLGNTLDLFAALPDLTGNVTIHGPGADQLTLTPGPNASRLFTVASGASVTLDGLTLANGTAQTGGILNRGTLTISDSSLSGNTGGIGGLIDNAGTLALTNCNLTNHSEQGAPNAPVLTAFDGITLQGSLTGTPNTRFRVDVFAQPLGPPVGQSVNYLRSLTVTTGTDGSATFSVNLGSPTPGLRVLATATDLPTAAVSGFSNRLFGSISAPDSSNKPIVLITPPTTTPPTGPSSPTTGQGSTGGLQTQTQLSVSVTATATATATNQPVVSSATPGTTTIGERTAVTLTVPSPAGTAPTTIAVPVSSQVALALTRTPAETLGQGGTVVLQTSSQLAVTVTATPGATAVQSGTAAFASDSMQQDFANAVDAAFEAILGYLRGFLPKDGPLSVPVSPPKTDSSLETDPESRLEALDAVFVAASDSGTSSSFQVLVPDDSEKPGAEE